jgi:SAM-dependent methyltransferase
MVLMLGMALGCGRPDLPSQTPSNGTNADMFSASDAYERFMGRWSRQLAEPFLAFAGVSDAETVLDVGSGTGSLSAAILTRTTSTRVVGIDPAREYVAAAARRVGGSRAVFEVGDAQRLRYADGSFDRALSLLVVNFIPDRSAAVREMVRVTRSGGVVAAAVWDYGGRMEMLRVFWDEAVALDPAVEPRDERHMPLSRAGELAAFWTMHGLQQVEEAPVEIPMAFASFDDYWRPFLEGQGPAGAYAAGLAEAPRAALEARLRQRLLKGTNDGPITLTARAWAVKGVVSAR